MTFNLHTIAELATCLIQVTSNDCLVYSGAPYLRYASAGYFSGQKFLNTLDLNLMVNSPTGDWEGHRTTACNVCSTVKPVESNFHSATSSIKVRPVQSGSKPTNSYSEATSI